MRFDFPFLKKKQEKVYYFCLYITDSFLAGFVLDLTGGKETIITERKKPLTSSFEKLLEDTDSLISDLELQTKVSLEKTIFFLHSTMIDGATHDIKEPYKEYIKRISKDLELEPLGYIDVQEAIEDYINSKSIFNSLIVELNKTELGIFIYKGGKVVHSSYAVRTQNIAADLNQELLTVPGTHIIPSKMIIYGDLDNTQSISQIAQFNWDKKIFVQHPIIEAFKDTDLFQALAHSFAKELGSNGEIVEEEEGQVAVTASSSFGFKVGEDIAATGERPAVLSSEHGDSEQKTGKDFSSVLTPFLHSISAFFKPSRKGNGSRKAIIFTIVTVVLFVGLFLVYEYFFHKVTLKVYVQSKNVEKEFELSLPITDKADSKKPSLIKYISVLDFKDEKATTGEREIGEKAKGEVVVHNFDNSERTIERGTEIKYKELIYLLDTDIKVASSSGVTSDGTKQSGKETVAVTAEEIGDEYNVAKGTQFTIGSLAESLFIAIAEESFTGGSKKKVNTVSKQDMDALELAVEKEAKGQSGKVLSAKISKDELLLSDLSEVTVSEATYSKELGEEADKVAIEATSEIEYYTVNKKSMQEALKKELSDEQSQDYTLEDKSITFTIEDVESEKDEAVLTVNTKANLFKKIDVEQIKEVVPLKPIVSMTELLKDRFPVEKIEIENKSTTVPFLSAWSPLFKKNIEILTTAN